MGLQEHITNYHNKVVLPLENIRKQIADLNTIHNDCVKAFGNILSGLLTGSDGQPAFEGPGSLALSKLVGDFLDAEKQLAGSDDPQGGKELEGNMLSFVRGSEQTAQNVQNILNTAGTSVDMGVKQATAFMGVVDAGAVEQGLINVPWDVIAGGVTLGVGALALTEMARNSEWGKTVWLDTQVEAEVTIWEGGTYGNGSDPITEPLAKLPPRPNEPNDPNSTSQFLKMLGIGTLGIVILGSMGAVGGIVWNQMTQQQREEAIQKLKEHYPECEGKVDWDAFVNAHSNLTLNQMVEYLDMLSTVQSSLDFAESLRSDPRFKDGIESLIKRLRSPLNSLLKNFYKSFAPDFLGGVWNNFKGAWYELGRAMRFADAGRLNIFGRVIKIPLFDASGNLILDSSGKQMFKEVDVDVNIDGGKTWVETKDQRPLRKPTDPDITDRRWDEFEDQVKDLFEQGKKQGVQEIEFDFQQGMSPDQQELIKSWSKETGIRYKIPDPNSIPPKNISSSHRWCDDSRVKPRSSSKPTPEPIDTPTEPLDNEK